MKKLLWEVLVILLFLLMKNVSGQSGQWVWMKGDTTYDVTFHSEQVGIEDSSINPPSLYLANSWTDDSGYLYLFGGVDYKDHNVPYYYDYLWRFNPKTNNWKLVKRSPYINSVGYNGTLGVPDTNNYPGSRVGGILWQDNNGMIWLFGGDNYYWGTYNDIWTYDAKTNAWTWMGGLERASSSGPGLYGDYGIKGVTSPTNLPPPRRDAASWVDADNNLWMFGGYCYCYGDKFYNDLWKYDTHINQWTWIGGTNITGDEGYYGGRLNPDTSHLPRSRACRCSWTDDAGNFYLYGGTTEFDLEYGKGDVWKYNPNDRTWDWIAGSSGRDFAGKSGTKCLFDFHNYPSARIEPVCLRDKNIVWIFSGSTRLPYPGANSAGDLWKYDINENSFTSIWGDSLMSAGKFNEMGIPDLSNNPRGRSGAVGWLDQNKNLWFYGGNWGVSSYAESDLWEYFPDSLCGVITYIQDVLKNQQIKLSPNPASDQIQIQSRTSNQKTLSILTLLGQVIFQNTFYSSESINVSSFPKGMYLVKISDQQGKIISTEKLVRE